ncbi:hypothetical protein Syun_023893 [Stephania yunnanensis]|uniref:Uncharacterized protein n=1 Tax=Stephania yunnanensis TaxID=152371 RepID=A0AAP0FK16_9MAGN
MKKSVDSRRADDEENPLAKKPKKKSVLADQTESMNGSKKKTMTTTTKKKSASFEGRYEDECAVKKTKKKSSLRGIKLKKVSVEIGRKDEEVQLGIEKVKTKQKKCSAKMESVCEEPAKKKKKKKKKKLSKVSEEVTAKKKMKKRSSVDCEEVSDEVEESAKKKKKKKKKKISLDKTEEEGEGDFTSVAELKTKKKKKKKTSHIVKELPNKKTKKRKESFFAKIEACETPSVISKPRKKKKKKSSESSDANECVVNATKKRSMAQREILVVEKTPKVDETERTAKDASVDTKQRSFESPKNWPLEFKKQQKDIIALWHACNVFIEPTFSCSSNVILPTLYTWR